MAKKKGKHKYEVGLIVAIPLPDGKFAFAKVFQGSDFGVYSLVSDKIEPVEEIVKNEFAFFQGGPETEVINGQWPIVAHEPFEEEKASWAPPKAAGILPQHNLGTSNPQISHRGSLTPARIEDVVGLDIDSFCPQPDSFIDVLVDRLIKGKHEKYQVQP